jgi:hypothetical protein
MGDPSRLGWGCTHRLITARFRWYGVSNSNAVQHAPTSRHRRLSPARARGPVGLQSPLSVPQLSTVILEQSPEQR